MIQLRTDEFLKPFFVISALLIVQKTFLHYLAIEGVLPEFTVLALVFYTLLNGRIWGLVAASIVGLVSDLIGGELAGSSALSLSIAMFVTGKFYNEKASSSYLNSQIFSAIVFLAVVVNAITHTLILNYDATANIFVLFLKQGVLPGFYTAFFAVFVVLFFPRKGYYGAH